MPKPDFKAMRKAQAEKAKKGEAYKTEDDKKSFADERFWKIGKDSDGNGEATIRLVPSLNKEQDNLNTFVIRKVHSINTVRPGTDGKDKNDKRWRSFLCPGDDCPVCKHGWEEYNRIKDEENEKNPNPSEDEQKVIKEKLKAVLQTWLPTEEIITNMMVVDDPINTDNNGKVFLFNLKKGILELCDKEAIKVNKVIEKADAWKGKDDEKYQEILADEFISEDVDTFDAYDLFTNGKNVELVYVNKKDKARWSKPSDYWGYSKIATRFKPAIKSDDEFEELMGKTFCLDEFTDPNNFEGSKMKIMPLENFQDEIDFLKFDIDNISDIRKKRKAAAGKGEETKEEKAEVKEEPKKESAQDKAMKKMAEKKEEVVEETKEPETTPEPEAKEEPKVEEKVEESPAGSDDTSQDAIKAVLDAEGILSKAQYDAATPEQREASDMNEMFNS